MAITATGQAVIGSTGRLRPVTTDHTISTLNDMNSNQNKEQRTSLGFDNESRVGQHTVIVPDDDG
jgi:hypothetical protein